LGAKSLIFGAILVIASVGGFYLGAMEVNKARIRDMTEAETDPTHRQVN
jgi:hypothetical protein